MKCLLILLIPLSQLCYSQNTGDALRKYSYYIMGGIPTSGAKPIGFKNKNYHIYQGTGIFFTHDNTLYFITASHVLSGMNGKCEKYADFPDTMNIHLMNDNGNFNNESISVNLSILKDTFKCLLFNEPDIIKYKVNNPNKYQIFTINNFLPTIIPANKDADEIVSFGYPISESYKDSVFKIVPSTQLTYYRPYYLDNNFITTEISNYGQKDTIHYRFTGLNMPLVKVSPGISGAPVYIKKKFTNSWELLGLINKVLITDGKVSSILITKSSFIF